MRLPMYPTLTCTALIYISREFIQKDKLLKTQYFFFSLFSSPFFLFSLLFFLFSKETQANIETILHTFYKLEEKKSIDNNISFVCINFLVFVSSL